MLRLIINGYHKDLTKDDVWQIEESEECQNLTERLEKVWNPLAEKYINENRILNKLSDEQIAYKKSNGHTEDSVTIVSLLYLRLKISTLDKNKILKKTFFVLGKYEEKGSRQRAVSIEMSYKDFLG